ncbi:Integral membrane protein [Mycoplasmopsis canis PG 14]|uniref:Integral membrane protein (Intg_mem_TP0381) n=1 Tax=Mycoplasmopsis canis TaxID=29555 RepID=A0A449AQ41_9BACT|nr:YwaF family protein [Mycoplasmopsis canis]EIE40514.1 Integral membrane protein [Mycoplasmopsis canis PG 14]VEU68685.1 Integral membrane protein (intg_mem_TP0381) [Mycoplasmopsis canis]
MGFLHYRRNIVDFESSKGIFYIFFGIAIFIVLIMFIYRKKIHTYFNESQRRFIFNLLSLEELLMLIGFIALFFNFLRLFFLIFIDFPFKSELIPLHLCRFFTFLIPVLFIFRKGYKINLFSPIAIIGAVLGFLFVNLGVIPEVIADDIKYHDLVPGTKEYELAGYNVGYDGVRFYFSSFICFYYPSIYSYYILRKSKNYNISLLKRCNVLAYFIMYCCYIECYFIFRD